MQEIIKINELEKKYFMKLKEVFTSEIFLKDIRELENKVIQNYDKLKLMWLKSNKIDIALERIVKYYIFRNKIVKGAYTSPISSDVAFYTDDCIICLDTKSVNYISNRPDIGCINTSRNQINFKNNFCRNIPYIPQLPYKENDKPILTYFLQLEYEEDLKTNSFKLINFNLSCVPNYILSGLYNNDIIQNYKTYEYISNELALELEKIGYPDLHPEKEIKDNWLEKSKTIYLDKEKKNPFYKDGTLYKKYNSNGVEYRAVISGSAARINPNKLEKSSHKKLDWNRHISWDI